MNYRGSKPRFVDEYSAFVYTFIYSYWYIYGMTMVDDTYNYLMIYTLIDSTGCSYQRSCRLPGKCTRAGKKRILDEMKNALLVCIGQNPVAFYPKWFHQTIGKMVVFWWVNGILWDFMGFIHWVHQTWLENPRTKWRF